MQSRKQAMIEALTNSVVGFGISVLLNMVLIPCIFPGVKVSMGQSFTYVFLFTVVSVVRSYVLRRLFNRWHR